MSSTLHESYPVARRPHRCSDCNRLIQPGERYHRWKGVSDSGIWPGVATSKVCAECCERYGKTFPGETP